ncbi:TATA-binding protein-associated factor mot1, partial [Rhizoclosmatium hyalinum]
LKAGGEGVDVVQRLFFGYLGSGSAGHRFFVHIVVEEVSVAWYLAGGTGVVEAVSLLKGAWDSMMAGLVAADSGAQVMFNELVPHLGRVRMECQALINAFAEVKATGCPALPPLPFSDPSASDPTNPFGLTFTPKVAERFLAEVVPQLFAVVQQNLQPGRGDPTAYLLDRQSRISHALETYAHETIRQETMTTASASCAIVHLATLPPKLNPIVRSLMGSIKTESSELIQSRSAKGVAGLLDLSSRGGKTGGVLDKVVKNLGVHLCNEAEWGNCFSVPGEVGILMMTISEKEEAVEVKSREGKKGKELNNEALAAVESAAGVIADLGVLNKVKSEVARRGARFAFQETCSLFGATVFDRLPKLWEICSQGILEFGVETAVTTDLDPAAVKCKSDPVFAQTVVDSLVTLATVIQAVDLSLHDRLCTLLRPVCRILRTPLMVVRHAAGLCIAAFAKTCTPQTFKSMVENVVPLLGDSTSVIRRQGAIEAISLVISNLEESRLLPYIVFLIVPVLGR